MTNYNWCHNPDCHKVETQSRVRGSGDNKVLRTVKIKETKWNEGHIFRYFCNQNCLFQFLNKFVQQITDTYSVKKPSETPIKITTHTYDMGYREGQTYKTIEKIGVDNT